MCLDETTACCTTRFVNGENTFGHIQPFVVIWSDISWSLFIQWKFIFYWKREKFYFDSKFCSVIGDCWMNTCVEYSIERKKFI
jgi:hypothetical protein